MKSRELVLDAAERVMAEHGYAGTSLTRIIAEAGIPISSIYHYFGSKDGILLAVMERGAERFFEEIPEPAAPRDGPEPYLRQATGELIEALDRHPHFLRLLIAFSTQPDTAANGDVRAVVMRVRTTAVNALAAHIALAFGDSPGDPVTAQLARIALAVIDGAFVAAQTGSGAALAEILLPWSSAIAPTRSALRAQARTAENA